MVTDFFEKIIKDNHLYDIIKLYSPVAGEIMLYQMMSYEKIFGVNGSSYLFVWTTLQDLISRHEIFGFYARTETDEKNRSQVLNVLTSEIYETGKKWLKDNGHAEPKHAKP